MTFYRRRLPHWLPDDCPVFVTWRLRNSLPEKSSISVAGAQPKIIGEEFQRIDQRLDHVSTGPLWLEDPRIASMVAASFEFGAHTQERYDLHAFVVMPNHVHLLITPHVPLLRITQGLKGFTARKANEVLGRIGQPFWQDESFDHWVRDGAQFREIVTYIHHNPVTAGLAERPEDWQWSSANSKNRAG
jgi:REP element-mobilizing transposase RayT